MREVSVGRRALFQLAVLGLLVFEVVMTRRLVQGGHEAVEGDGAGGLDQP